MTFGDILQFWATFMKSKYSIVEHPSMVQFRYPTSPLWRRLYFIRCIIEPHIPWLIDMVIEVSGMIDGLILYLFSILILQQLLWPQYFLFGVVWNGTG